MKPTNKKGKPILNDGEQKSMNDFLIIGIGASAGGLEAYKEFFQAIQGNICNLLPEKQD